MNLYIAGEAHTTSRQTRDGITQITTGSPVNTGKFTYLSTRQYADRMELEIHSWDVKPTVTGPDVGFLWQGGPAVPELTGSGHTKMNHDYVGHKPVKTGAMTIYLGSGVSGVSGVLVPWTGSPKYELPSTTTVAAGRSATIALRVSNGDPVGGYEVRAHSNNQAVARVSVSVSGSGTSYVLTVMGKKRGQADISVRVTSPPGTALGQLLQRDMRVTVT